MIAAIFSPAPSYSTIFSQGDERDTVGRVTGGAGVQAAASGGSERGLNAPVSVRAVKPASATSDSKPPDPNELTEAQEREVQELRKRETEVRAHEAAHEAAAGPYGSGKSFEYTTGPDGKRYISGGEVKIDAAPVRDNPEATIRKMEVVLRAALAPSDPSSQDRQVARQAQQTRAKAQAELAKQRAAENGAEGARAGAGPARTVTSRPEPPAANELLQAGSAYGSGIERSSPAGVNPTDIVETIPRLPLTA